MKILKTGLEYSQEAQTALYQNKDDIGTLSYWTHGHNYKILKILIVGNLREYKDGKSQHMLKTETCSMLLSHVPKETNLM